MQFSAGAQRGRLEAIVDAFAIGMKLFWALDPASEVGFSMASALGYDHSLHADIRNAKKLLITRYCDEAPAY